MLPDTVSFVLVIATIVSAVLTVEFDDMIRAVVSFCVMCLMIGGLYAYWGATVAALFQVIVYSGAVAVLFLITVMLTHAGWGE